MKRLIIFTIFLSTSRLELFAQEILAEEIYKYADPQAIKDPIPVAAITEPKQIIE